MAVIAQQLGHSDTRMTERHYGHLAPNYVTDTNRANFLRLMASAATVVPIGRARTKQSKRA
jgi:integrase